MIAARETFTRSRGAPKLGSVTLAAILANPSGRMTGCTHDP